MRSDFYYWLTTVVIVTVLFGLFIEFLWTTAKVPDIVCRIPDSGYYRISQILPDNPALPDIRYIPTEFYQRPLKYLTYKYVVVKRLLITEH